MDRRRAGIVQFLNKMGYLEKIRSDYQLIMNASFLYPITLELNVMDLGDFDADLANFLLREPLKFQLFLKQAICAEIVENRWLRSLENVGQLMVTLRVFNLPPFTELSIRKFTDLSQRHRQSYVKLDGIVVALSAIVNYTHGANYVCQNSRCMNSNENKLIRIHIPGAQECQTVR